MAARSWTGNWPTPNRSQTYDPIPKNHRVSATGPPRPPRPPAAEPAAASGAAATVPHGACAPGQPPHGLGAALPGLAAAGPDRRLRHTGPSRARLPRPRHANHESGRFGARYSGNALVLTADAARTGPDSAASPPAADADRGLGGTA